jgi:hypothetical protein
VFLALNDATCPNGEALAAEIASQPWISLPYDVWPRVRRPFVLRGLP